MDPSAALRDMMVVVLKLGGPVLLVALAVGTVMSLVQTITQVNEPTLGFIPKAVVIGGVLFLLGPFMLTTLRDYTTRLLDPRLLSQGVALDAD